MLPGGSGGCSRGQHRALPGYHLHHREGVGPEDSGETHLPLSATKLCSITKKNVCFSRVWAVLNDLVKANLLFSVLCALGLVTIKAAVLIFSSRIVLAFFSHGLSAEKEKQICYLQSYSAPTAGQGGGRLARRPGGSRTLLVRIG